MAHPARRRRGAPPGAPWSAQQVHPLALQPLRDKLEDWQVDSMAEALGFVVGAEVVISLLDALQLSPEAAKERQLRTAMWILRGGLAEFDATDTPGAKKKPRRPPTS